MFFVHRRGSQPRRPRLGGLVRRAAKRKTLYVIIRDTVSPSLECRRYNVRAQLTAHSMLRRDGTVDLHPTTEGLGRGQLRADHLTLLAENFDRYEARPFLEENLVADLSAEYLILLASTKAEPTFAWPGWA